MRPNEQKALLASMVVLAVSTLAMASAPRWATCLSAGLALLAAVPLVASRRVLQPFPPLLLVLLVCLVGTFVQLTPLPADLVRWLSPARYSVSAANAAAYGLDTPSRMSLTHDVAGSLIELLKFAAYVAFAFLCLRLNRLRKARYWIVATIATTGVLVAICALGHRLANAETVMGLYEPQVVYRQSLSPFLNPNHLANYLAFVTPLALGLALARRSWLWGIGAGICALTSLQAVSRGGVVSLCVGIVVSLVLFSTVLMAQSRRKRRRSFYAAPLLLGAAFVGASVLGATAGADLLNLDLQREQEAGKMLAWSAAPELLDGALWTGVGRGAFQPTFQRVQPQIGATFSHIENEYLQVLLDWGVVVTLILVILLVQVIRSILRRRPLDALTAGMIGALTAVAVQSLVDFGLELPGMFFPVLAVVSLATEPTTLAVVSNRRKRRLHQGIRFTGITAGVILCALGASPHGASAKQDLDAAPALSAPFTASPDQVIAAAADLARRHPADYRIPSRAAQVLFAQKDPRAFRALARALEANPNHWGVHFLAARMLSGSQARRQALAEYRAALRLPGHRRGVLQSLMETFPDPQDIAYAIPSTPKHTLNYGRALLHRKQHAAALLVAQRAYESGNRQIEFIEFFVESLLREDKSQLAVKIGSETDAREESPRSLVIYVRALRAAGLPLVALALLEDRLANTPIANQYDFENLDAMTALQFETGALSAAQRSAQRLLDAARRDAHFRQKAHFSLANIEDQLGNSHRANWHRRQAHSSKDH